MKRSMIFSFLILIMQPVWGGEPTIQPDWDKHIWYFRNLSVPIRGYFHYTYLRTELEDLERHSTYFNRTYNTVKSRGLVQIDVRCYFPVKMGLRRFFHQGESKRLSIFRKLFIKLFRFNPNQLISGNSTTLYQPTVTQPRCEVILFDYVESQERWTRFHQENLYNYTPEHTPGNERRPIHNRRRSLAMDD